jgi:NDP-sugar pyrophosphorylase family protein
VLAAGLGTRLRPLTNVRAKPAVPVAGRPLLVRILEWLAGQGVTEVVLNLHHRPETIARLVGHGQKAGVRVRYSWEPVILGSAGGPRQALPLLGRRFFIVNGDTLTTVSLQPLADTHARTGAAVTLAVAPHPDPSRYGGVLVTDDGRVRGFAPAGAGPAFHFVGVQVVQAAVFEGLPAGRPASTIGGIYDGLLSAPGRGGAPIRAHRVDDEFLDVGTPADYLAASLAVARREGHESMPAGAGSTIDPTASLDRTAIWDDAVVGAGCHLEECIVTDGVRLPPGTALRRRICVRAMNAGTRGKHIVGNAIIHPLDGLKAADR